MVMVMLMLLLLLLLTTAEGFICQGTKFPYYISLLAPVPYVEECLLYEERRDCDGNDLSIQIQKYDARVRITLSSNSLGVSATDQFTNKEGPVDKIDSITIEILWDTVIIYDDFVPVRQMRLENSNITQPILKCTDVVQSNGNCKIQPCQVLSCYKATDFSSSFCMINKLPACAENKGFCHGGKCVKTHFGGSQCQCRARGFLRGPYLGEFCSIKSDKGYRSYAQLVHSFDVELDFVSSIIIMGVTSVFENFAYPKVKASLYQLPLFQLVETQSITSESGDMTIKFSVNSNTSYVIKYHGEILAGVPSYYHFIEIHTPGYSLSPPPTNLSFFHTPMSLTVVTWSNHNPKYKDVKLTYSTEFKNESVTTSKNFVELSLASRTKYTVIVQALNPVDEEGPESKPLTFETPYFLHDLHSHGSFNFSTWLFRESTVSVTGNIINFKHTIRRDIRVKEVAIILYKGTVPVSDINLVYQTVIYNTSYSDHKQGGSYITAKFSNQSIPKTLLLGDGLVRRGFLNGVLEIGSVYQVR